MIKSFQNTMRNTIRTKVSKNCHSKKVKYKLVAMFCNHITIDNYYYLLLLCKAWVKN